MRATIAIRDDDWSALAAALDVPTETAAVLSLGVATSAEEVTFSVRSLSWVPDETYTRRTASDLEITSAGWMPALAKAAHADACAAFLHTHPGGDPKHSPADERVDDALAGPFHVRTGQRWYVSVVLAGTCDAPTFAARAHHDDGRVVPVTRLRVIGGGRLRLFTSAVASSVTPISSTDSQGDSKRGTAAGPGAAQAIDLGLFDRQIRAFGEAGQRILAALHVGIVGAGGIGSAVAEQLIRLGIGRLTIIDDEVVTATNLTRIHGSGSMDVGVAKTAIVARTAGEVGETTVTAARRRVVDPATASLLKHCDVIFGCTDDERGRGVLSRLAYYYLIPLLDTGFVITSTDGGVTGLDGRVTMVAPGTACLLCRRRIDPALMRVESLGTVARATLAAEGYAPELAEPDPSVVVYTTMIGSIAVHEFLARLFGWAGDQPPSEVLLRLYDHQLRTNTVPGSVDHYCTDTAVWGRADTDPLLDQVWAD